MNVHRIRTGYTYHAQERTIAFELPSMSHCEGLPPVRTPNDSKSTALELDTNDDGVKVAGAIGPLHHRHLFKAMVFDWSGYRMKHSEDEDDADEEEVRKAAS